MMSMLNPIRPVGWSGQDIHLQAEKTAPVNTDVFLIEDSADAWRKKKVTLQNLMLGTGSGDVVGPAGATANAVPRWDGTTGKLIKDSLVSIDDTGKMTVAGLDVTSIADGYVPYVGATGLAASPVSISSTQPVVSIGGGIRPFQYRSDIGGAFLKANAAAWAMGYYFKGSSDTALGGFGAYGSIDSCTRYFIGTYSTAECVSILASSGFFGINITNPLARCHIVQNSFTGNPIFSEQMRLTGIHTTQFGDFAKTGSVTSGCTIFSNGSINQNIPANFAYRWYVGQTTTTDLSAVHPLMVLYSTGLLSLYGSVATGPTMEIKNGSYGTADAAGTVHLMMGFAGHGAKTIEVEKYAVNQSFTNLWCEYGFNVAHKTLAMWYHGHRWYVAGTEAASLTSVTGFTLGAVPSIQASFNVNKPLYSSSFPGNCYICDTATMAGGAGGGVLFGGYYNSSANTFFSCVQGFKENATDGNFAGALRVLTRVHSAAALTERTRWDSVGNMLHGVTAAGSSAVKVFALGNGTAPTTSPADMFQMYSADVAAGNACPHFRTENGAVVKLYQQAHIADPAADTTSLRTAVMAILTAMENGGLLATS